MRRSWRTSTAAWWSGWRRRTSYAGEDPAAATGRGRAAAVGGPVDAAAPLDRRGDLAL